MRQKDVENHAPMGRTVLSFEFNSTWEHLLAPALRELAATAWQKTAPTILLVPTRNFGFFIKGRMLEKKISAAGIHFWTPADLRAFFIRQLSPAKPVLSTEEAALLLAISAEEIHDENGDNSIAASIMMDPLPLLTAIRQLETAGWNFSQLKNERLQPIVSRWEKLVAKSEFQNLTQLDREIGTLAQDYPPLIESLIVIGFDSQHWPLQRLLLTALLAAKNFYLCLNHPAEQTLELDQTWIGLWEELFGAADPLPPASQNKSQPEISTSILEEATFYLGDRMVDEAKLITALTLQSLANDHCTRLGIVFPKASALAREVSSQLAEAGVLFHDGFGFQQLGVFDQSDWEAWMEFQKHPGVRTFLEMLEHLEIHSSFTELEKGTLFHGLNFSEIESVLDKAIKKTLIDDFPFLSSYFHSKGDPKSVSVAKIVETFPLLPEKATLHQFLSLTESSLKKMNWERRASLLSRQAKLLSLKINSDFSRIIFLQWLEKVAVSNRFHRPEEGAHFYSRVHLLSYEEAERQDWSHLILTSLNDGEWPSDHDDLAHLSAHQIENFNQSVIRLNLRATKTGSQGEGHLSTEIGKGILIGSWHRKKMAERRFARLLEATVSPPALTAHLRSSRGEVESQRLSPLFSNLFFTQRGTALNDFQIQHLERKSRKLIENLPLKKRSEKKINLDPVLKAYKARREQGPFGEYEFSLIEPLQKPLQLSCKEWEQALKRPAALWMEKVLGVESQENLSQAALFRIAGGIWVHEWLAKKSDREESFLEREPDFFKRRVQNNSEKWRSRIERLIQKNRGALPEWWLHFWRQLRYAAIELAGAIDHSEPWKFFATEFSISEKTPFLINGIIDLLLSPLEENASNQIPQPCWIIDYKTGKDQALKPKSLAQGDGVQLALYALGLEQKGLREINLCLLQPEEKISAQLTLAQIHEQPALWDELLRMQTTGCFGNYGRLRERHQVGTVYPIATLEIDPEILKEKWAATHPAWVGVLKEGSS